MYKFQSVNNGLGGRSWLVHGLLWLGIASLWGCQPPVGGRCDYQEQLGLLEVIKAVDGDMVGVFSSVAGVVGDDTEGLELPAAAQVSLFRFYPARLSIRTEGSCTPFFVDLLSDDRWSRGVAIPLDSDGRDTALTRARITEVAALFARLLRDRPAARLLLFGYGGHGYSAEYASNLTRTYEDRLKQRLLERGLSPRQLELSYGALPAHLAPPMPAQGNGVQVFFLLEQGHEK